MNLLFKRTIAVIVTSLLATNALAGGYLLQNTPMMSRAQWWADESRRVSGPKKTTSEYKPGKQTEYQKKVQIAEEYVVNAFPKEFQVDKVIRKWVQGTRLKRPLSYKYKKKKLIIHHTAEVSSWLDSIEKEKEAVREIYRFHTFSRWRGDIGYNYLIAPSGTIFEGRNGGSDVIAAHAVWNNTESIGISLLGDFNKEKPTKEQLQSLIKLLVALWHNYGINPLQEVTYHTFDANAKQPHIHNIKMDSVVGHQDVWSTSCPWDNLYKLLPTIKRAVAKELWYVQLKKRIINTR